MSITTRFGGTVTLIAPVDWNSGWAVGIIRHEGAEPTRREIHTSELKADGGLNEIAAVSDAIENHLCCDCHQPMEVAEQEQRSSTDPLVIVTCKNRACSLWSVTLSTDQYWSLTDEQLATYRTMVAGLKARLGSL